MWLEGRTAALLVALSSIMSACGGSVTPLSLRPATGPKLRVATHRALAEARARPTSSPQAGAEIRGRLATSDRRQLLNGTLVMMPEDGAGASASIDAIMRPDGSFVFSNVPPGSYLIRALAQTEPNGPPLFALFRVTVRGPDVEGINLILLPGATISGRLVTGSGSASPVDALASARVRAPFNDGSFGDAQTGAPQRDGSFAIRGVMAGPHLLVVDGLPAPWSVKSVTFRGQDITDTGVQADSGQRFDDVKITITAAASEVSGIVREGGDRVVARARVLVVPVPAQLWPPASRRFARSLTDAAGHYSVRGLPAGNYRVAAALELEDRDAYRAEVLRAVREEGVAVTLEETGTLVVDLSLTRIPLSPRVAVR